VLYDAAPFIRLADFCGKLAADTGTSSFGASPTFIQMMEKAGLCPKDSFDLSRIESIVVSGAPSSPETFAWLYRSVKQDLWAHPNPRYGGDMQAGFVGAVPTLPVYAGEIQARMLGMDVHVWNESGEEIHR